MKNLQLITCLTFMVLLCSCKKDENQAPTDPASSLIKRITYTDTTGSYIGSASCQYDSQGKLVLLIFDNPPYSDSLIHKYEYYPDKVIEKIFLINNTKYGRIVYDLNSDGLVTSETDIEYNQSGDSAIAKTITYKYNEDGFAIEKKSYLFGDTANWSKSNWQILNGNISSMTFSMSIGGGGSFTESYEYYSNSVNTLGYTNLGRLYFGKSSNNLVKSSISNNPTPDRGTFSYSFDSMNRVIKETIRGSGLTVGNGNLLIDYY